MNETETKQLEITLRQKWADRTTDNGKLKNRYQYGAFRNEPLLPKEAALFVSGGTNVEYAKQVLAALKSGKSGLSWQPISDNKKLIKALECNDQEGHIEEALGRYGTIMTLGELPNYFAKRDGQKLIRLTDEKTDPEKAAELLILEDAEDAKESRRKILIIVNANTANLGECLRAACDLSSFMDTDKNEVIVLVSGTSEDGLDAVRSRAFPQGVRVVTRKGTFACSAEEYIYVNLLMDMFGIPDENAKKVFEMEALRVTGTSGFDNIICLGDPDKYCYYMAACLDAKKTVRIDIEMSASEQQKATITSGRRRSMATLQEMEDRLFDAAVTNLRGIAFDSSRMQYAEDGLRVVEYEGRQYCMIEMTPESLRGKYIQLMPCPQKAEETYVAYGDSDSIDKVMKQFADKNQQGKVLYIYGGSEADLKSNAESCGIADNVVLVNKADIPSEKYLKSYLSLFDAYITADPTEYNEVGYLMQDLCKPVLLADGSEAQGVSMNENLTHYRDWLLQQIL